MADTKNNKPHQQDDTTPQPKIVVNQGGQFTFNEKATGAFGEGATYNNNAPKPPSQKKQGPAISAPSSDNVPSNGVFISYSHKDSDKVSLSVQTLYNDNIIPWWDQANIPPGANWRDEIQYALEKSSVGVLFISQASLNSPIVRDEYRYFLNTKKRLIPVLCEMISLPAELQNINYVIYQDFARVVRMLKEHQSKG